MSPSSMVRRRSGLYVPRSGGGGAYAAAVLADSPLWYPKLDETSGTSAADSSGLGRAAAAHTNAPTVGQTSLLSDGTGKSVTYNGTSAYTSETYASAWMNPAAVAWEAIIQPTSTSLSGVRAIVSRWESSVTVLHTLLYVTGGKAAFTCMVGGVQKDAVGATTLTAGSKYHVVGKFDGTTLKVIVNGTVDGSLAASGSLPTSTAAIEIARCSQSNSTCFAGGIDEVAYYAGLSDTRAAAHAALR